MEPAQLEQPDLRRDYVATLTTVRKWRTFFVVLTSLCLLVHAGAWAAVYFKAVPSSPRASVLASPQPPTAPQPAPAADSGEAIWNTIRVALPTTEFAGRLSAALLCLSMLFAALVALAGRLPSSGYVQAFYGSLIVLALLIPWDRLTPQSPRVPGIFIDAMVLETPPDAPGVPQPPALVFSLLRFVAYPVLAILLLGYSARCFGRSYREAAASPGASIPMRVV